MLNKYALPGSSCFIGSVDVSDISWEILTHWKNELDRSVEVVGRLGVYYPRYADVSSLTLEIDL